MRSPSTLTTLRQMNQLHENAKKRIHRALLPPDRLGRYGIQPVTGQELAGDGHVRLRI
jgi:hypothetical protein